MFILSGVDTRTGLSCKSLLTYNFLDKVSETTGSIHLTSPLSHPHTMFTWDWANITQAILHKSSGCCCGEEHFASVFVYSLLRQALQSSRQCSLQNTQSTVNRFPLIQLWSYNSHFTIQLSAFSRTKQIGAQICSPPFYQLATIF